MLVLFLTRLLAGGLEQAGRNTLGPLLLLQLLSLAVFLGLCVTAGPWIDPNAATAVIAGMFGVAAMATQNALVQISLKNTPTTAVMTTNVTHFMLDLGGVLVGGDQTEAAKARSRAIRTLPVIIGFATGCGLGAACQAAAGSVVAGSAHWPRPPRARHGFGRKAGSASQLPAPSSGHSLRALGGEINAFEASTGQAQLCKRRFRLTLRRTSCAVNGLLR